MKGISNIGKKLFLAVLLLLGVNLIFQGNTIAQEETSEEVIMVSCGIGARPEGSVSKSQSLSVKHSDIVQQIDDVLIILRNDTLYSIALNPETDEPLDVVSKQVVPGYSEDSDAYHYSVLASDQLVILLTELKGVVDFTFYSLNSYGELEYQQRSTIGDEDNEAWDYLTSATIVDNNLVFIAENIVENDQDETLSSVLSKGIESRHLDSEGESTKADIMLSRRWVNPAGAFEVSEEQTDVLVCPLDSVLDDGLKCHINSLIGVSKRSYFIGDQAIYVWGEQFVGGHYGVISHSPNDYAERSDLALDITLNEQQSMIYRIDLQYRDVTGVIVDGWPINSRSFEEEGDQFFALIYKDSELKINDDLVFGVRVGVDQFSDLPVVLPESDYQLLVDGEGRINANRFSENKIVLSRSINQYSESAINEVVLWDIENESLTSMESEFQVDDLYFINDEVLAIGSDDHGVKMQTWSVGDEVESLFVSNYEEFWVNENKFGSYFLGSHYGQTVWGLPINRLEGESNEFAEYKNSNDDDVTVQDMHYFEMLVDGTIVPIGKLLAEPTLVEEDCKVSCEEWYDVKRSFRVGDSFYSILGDEVLKANYEYGEVNFNSRLPLLVDESGESSAE